MMEALTHFVSSMSLEHLNVLLLLGIVLFGGTAGGKLFQKLRIPQVVGYITIGILIGQSGARIIGGEVIENLSPFSSFALAIIGFMIGGELKTSVIKKYGRQFTSILLFESLTSFVVVSALTSIVGLLIFDNPGLAVSLGLLLGSISSATAPAATTDVLWENRTRGPLTTTVLGIVAMDDGVCLLLFAIVSNAAGVLIGRSTAGLGASVLHLIYEIGVAVFLGIGFGFILNRIIRNFVDDERILAFSLGTILLLIGITQSLGVNTILAAMSMGFYIVNYAPRKSEETFRLVQKFAPPIYVLFFVLVGAKLNVWSVTLLVALLALVYLAGRTGGKFLGSYLGARLSRAPAGVRRYLPFCLFSQAGVAIGLSIVAGETFAGTLGNTIILVITATTFVVQIIGPPFVKYAVGKAGEVGLNITEEDLIRNSKASEIANMDLPLIEQNTSLQNILAIFAEQDALAYPVVDSGRRLIGVLSIENLKDTFMVSELSGVLLAHDIMEPVLRTCSPDTPAAEVMKDLKQYQLDYMPVISPDMVALGMIENRNIQRFLTRRLLEIRRQSDSLD